MVTEGTLKLLNVSIPMSAGGQRREVILFSPDQAMDVIESQKKAISFATARYKQSRVVLSELAAEAMRKRQATNKRKREESAESGTSTEETKPAVEAATIRHDPLSRDIEMKESKAAVASTAASTVATVTDASDTSEPASKRTKPNSRLSSSPAPASANNNSQLITIKPAEFESVIQSDGTETALVQLLALAFGFVRPALSRARLLHGFLWQMLTGQPTQPSSALSNAAPESADAQKSFTYELLLQKLPFSYFLMLVCGRCPLLLLDANAAATVLIDNRLALREKFRICAMLNIMIFLSDHYQQICKPQFGVRIVYTGLYYYSLLTRLHSGFVLICPLFG
jgi:hypothetical protein